MKANYNNKNRKNKNYNYNEEDDLIRTPVSGIVMGQFVKVNNDYLICVRRKRHGKEDVEYLTIRAYLEMAFKYLKNPDEVYEQIMAIIPPHIAAKYKNK